MVAQSSARAARQLPGHMATDRRSSVSVSQTLAMGVANEAHLFTFEDCTYQVKASTCWKTLISGVSALVSSGCILSILGPSGAGKTTLLKMLTLERGGGQPSGIVTLNGSVFNIGVYRRSCASLPQIDHHTAFLSAREHLEIAVSLFCFALTRDHQRTAV